MQNINVSELFIMFIIYCFLGYCWEVFYCAIMEKRLENRGFCIGPWLPIYGTGAILDILILGNNDSYLQVFIICIIGSAFLEFFTSFILEKLFHATWWDYSNYPFNLQGRICLFASIGFGVAGVIVRFVLHPRIFILVEKLSSQSQDLIALILMAVFSADVALTAEALIRINEKISTLSNKIGDILVQNYDNLLVSFGTIKDDTSQAFNDAKEKIRLQTIKDEAKKLKEGLSKNQLRLVRNARVIKENPKKKHYLDIFKRINEKDKEQKH